MSLGPRPPVRRGSRACERRPTSMAEIETIQVDWNWAKAWPLSQAIRCGDFVFLAGVGPVDTDANLVGRDLAAQARQVFENIRVVLDAAGARTSDIAKMTTYFVGDV